MDQSKEEFIGILPYVVVVYILLCDVYSIIHVVGSDLLDSQVSMHTKLLLYFVRKLASLTIIYTAFDKRITL